MTNRFPTNQEIIDSTLDLENKIYIFARVNPEAFASYRQDQKIGEWNPIAGTGGRRYFVELPLKTNEKILHKLLDDIHCLLTAYFLTDFQPRDLVDFKVLTGSNNQESIIPAMMIFGNSNFIEFPYSQDIGDEQIILSPRIRSMAVFDSPVANIQFSEKYPWNELKNHYEFIKTKPDLFKRLVLVREAFMNLNSAFSSQVYSRETELLIGTIILISTIESLILKGNKEEIRFKFSIIAAILYEKNVEETDFKNQKLPNSKTKLDFDEARQLFKTLYDIRSDLAHGTLNTVFKSSDIYWQKLAKIFHVGIGANQSFSTRMKNYALIMNFIQYHIAIFIKKSLHDFGGDPEIALKSLNVKSPEELSETAGTNK